MTGWGYIARTAEPMVCWPTVGTVVGVLDDSPHTPEHRIIVAEVITAIAGALQKASADIRRPPEAQETQGGVGNLDKDPA